MKLQTTRAFDRDYAALPERVKGQTDKQLALLLSNPLHPSLRLKKIRGTRDIWEARVTRGYRMTLQLAGETMILRRLGPHNVLETP